ncbi:MAG: DUF1446 domain-containing protein [Gammaproteobacteria bacterium]|nr:DUF1446 domain-containing protein [Gammaproteobacteria bacterium]
MSAAKNVRIGCGAGFWGDSAEGPAQLVGHGDIQYLVMDYLAEITMSLLARAKAKRPESGYATDFVGAVMRPLLPELAAKKIKVVTNAGGVNPEACRAALEAVCAELGVSLKIATVGGDDLLARAGELAALGITDMATGAPFPDEPWSANAYLGALPIAAALDLGADVVITGRVVDSALVLGPLVHEFVWAADDYDRLAAGSLAGHILECGAQATGGLFTDWADVAGWEDMGFPIAECAPDGTFTVTKPAGTGGLVSTATIAEQITYEIGDPARYVLPDCIADFSNVRLQQLGPDVVAVAGARGYPPTASYKTSVTYPDGFRCTATMMIGGIEAAAKARKVADAILGRTRRLFGARGLPDYTQTSVEVLGAEATYGPHARTATTREVVLKIGVMHADEKALELFAREIFPAATAMAPGLTGFAGGRPSPQPVVKLFSCLVPKQLVAMAVAIGDARFPIAANVPGHAPAPPPPLVYPAPAPGDTVEVPLLALAHGRSGDKGDSANVSVLARRPEYVAIIGSQLTADAVARYFAHLAAGPVTRFDWPGLHGFNFVLERALGGGGVASLRHDPQGKAYAQMLLDFPVRVPADWARQHGLAH